MKKKKAQCNQDKNSTSMEINKIVPETESNQPELNEKSSNVSCYKIDGALAHMEIEFEKESDSVNSSIQGVMKEGTSLTDKNAKKGGKELDLKAKNCEDSDSSMSVDSTKIPRKRGRPRKVVIENVPAKKAKQGESPNRQLPKNAAQNDVTTEAVPSQKSLCDSKNESKPLILSKLKAYNLNPGGDKSLRAIPDLCSAVKETHPKFLRSLYRVLYNEYPPRSESELMDKILDFKGFARMKSTDLDERQSSLKKLNSYHIAAIAMLFGIEVGSNNEMISEIIKFLMKPVKCIMSPVDPFAPFMQPTLQLQKISIGGCSVARSSKKRPKNKKKSVVVKHEVIDLAKEESPERIVDGKRKRFPSTRMKIYDVDIPEKTPQKVSEWKGAARGSTGKRKSTPSIKVARKTVRNSTSDEQDDDDASVEDVHVSLDESDDEYVPSETPMKTIASSPVGEVIDDNEHSDVTLSADEKEDKNENETPKRKNTFGSCPWIRPLSDFPNIKTKIESANLVSLQRLHIFLFGAPDEKADRLKINILSFGGFSFHEGSDEWKQKEFVFSLTSLNDIKEHMDLLCIDYKENEDQNTLINKLMKFLASPNNLPPEINTRVVSSQLINPAKTDHAKKSATKNKNSKGPKKTTEKRPGRRKVLMDEDEVRRLERDFAREQRILARERRLDTKSTEALRQKQNVTVAQEAILNQTDTQLLNALLQTVYKRRALKMAGAKISVPNKGVHTRLGELENVKFLIVTANHNDLDVLHHLIYMTEAARPRVRKNILDFAGFNFAEDSVPYQERIALLQTLGYEIAKRIAFLLGLCPFKMDIPSQDLNELIMYFLMSPCKSKQIPIRHMPADFFNNDMPQELTALVQQHEKEKNVTPTFPIKAAKKSFPTASGSSPSLYQKKIIAKGIIPNIFNKSVSSPITKLPQITPTVPIPFPDLTGSKTPQVIQIPQEILKSKKLSSDSSIPQEFLIQQKTPDGQQKTYMLVKLPNTHPLNAALKNQQSKVLPESNQPMVAGPPLPPGVVVFKNENQPVPYFAQSVSVENASKTTSAEGNESSLDSEIASALSNIQSKVVDETHESSCEEKSESTSEDDTEAVHTPGKSHSAPSKSVLFKQIQEIILGSNFEDITLRNVIERVSAQYPLFDLRPFHPFMKESVKKIIVGIDA